MGSKSKRVGSICAFVLTLSAAAFAQQEFDRARTLVSHVQNDLRRSERYARAEGREKERYQNAQHHLSEFDRKLSHGDFDKDKLDGAIDDVKNVVDHNTLSPEARDALTADLNDLRQLRSTRGRY